LIRKPSKRGKRDGPIVTDYDHPAKTVIHAGESTRAAFVADTISQNQMTFVY
jgi:hypothetical protein